MDKIELYNGDCLEVMKGIPDGSLFDKYCNDNKIKPIKDYQVALVDDLGYNEPVKFITGKGE